MLTQDDVKIIEDIVTENNDQLTGRLPSKQEFYTKMDEVMGELKTIREEQTTHSHDHSRIKRRLVRLESHTKLSPLVD